MDKFTSTAVYVCLLIGVVAIEVIIRLAVDDSASPEYGVMLATIGLGMVLPFLLFESLLLGKIHGIKRAFFPNPDGSLGMRIDIKQQVAAEHIPALKTATYILVIGCFIVWALALLTGLWLQQGITHPLVPLGFGIANCLAALAYFLI